MDYHRIYREFIKDRREKEPGLAGYTERHHILPRSLGGGDEPENLIRLTAEDHFFAHLLLAKMHGGKLWAPVAFMVGGTRKDYKPIQSRGWYGWASRAMAEANSGTNAAQYDPTIHHLRHRDGRKWSGTQMEMRDVLGISRSQANRLIKGIYGSAKGWFVEGTNPRFRGEGTSGKNHNMYRPEVIHFRHVDGRSFHGTQWELHVKHGISKSNACLLVKGIYGSAKGWYIEGRPPVAKTGRGAKYRKQLTG